MEFKCLGLYPRSSAVPTLQFVARPAVFVSCAPAAPRRRRRCSRRRRLAWRNRSPSVRPARERPGGGLLRARASRNRRPSGAVVPAKGHRAAQHDAAGIDRVHQVDDADAQVAGRFQHDLERQARRPPRPLRPTTSGVSFFAGGDPRRERTAAAGASASCVRSTTRRGAGVGFQMARLAAAAEPGVVVMSR